MNILFHDVDGCLNTEDGKELPHSDKTLSSDQLVKLEELGQALDASDNVDMMIINTGRALVDTLPVAHAIKSQKLTYIIAEHGAVIHDCSTNSLVEWNTTDDGSADPLIKVNALISWFNSDGQAYFEQAIGQAIHTLDKIANLTLCVPEGVDSDGMFETVQNVIKNDSPFDHADFVYHHSKTDGYIDIMSNIDKGDGVNFIKKHVNADDVTTIAVGNGLNDMPMMSVVDLCICPANSEPELLEYCQSRNSFISEYGYAGATIHWLRENSAAL